MSKKLQAYKFQVKSLIEIKLILRAHFAVRCIKSLEIFNYSMMLQSTLLWKKFAIIQNSCRIANLKSL